jgi:gliding motility-associated-like protein
MPSKGNLLDQGQGNLVYSPHIGYVGQDFIEYEICSPVCPDVCDKAQITLNVGNLNDCFIPTLFTPNNDGVNDLLIIPCLLSDLYPGNRIHIFNEWGDEVFHASPYLNDWDGRYKGDDLPVATYYYLIDFGDGSDIRKGFLILDR